MKWVEMFIGFLYQQNTSIMSVYDRCMTGFRPRGCLQINVKNINIHRL